MHMTDTEIRTSYRQSQNKAKQIIILSELNCCLVSKIKEIVETKTEEMNSRMKFLYDSGLTDLAISIRLGINQKSVGNWRKKNNLISKHKVHVVYDNELMMKMYDDGKSDTQIANAMKIRVYNVIRWRQINNLKTKFKRGKQI